MSYLIAKVADADHSAMMKVPDEKLHFESVVHFDSSILDPCLQSAEHLLGLEMNCKKILIPCSFLYRKTTIRTTTVLLHGSVQRLHR